MVKKKWSEKNLSLAVKLTLAAGCTIIAVTLGLTSYSIRRERQSFHQQIQQKAELMLDFSESVAFKSLYYQDYRDFQALSQIKNSLPQSQQKPMLISARVFDAQGRVIVDLHNGHLHHSLRPDPWGEKLLKEKTTVFDWQSEYLSAGRPVLIGKKRLGAVSVKISTIALQLKIIEMRRQSMVVLLIVSIASMTMVLVANWVVAKQIRATLESQRRFMNHVSHQLRTPITIIQGHLELIAEESGAEQETIVLLLQQLDWIGCLLNELLVLSRSDLPNFLHKTVFDLELFTEEFFLEAQALAKRDWRLEGTATGKIVGDRQRLGEAVIKLVKNSIQRTQEGDVITLGSATTQKEGWFWVRDGKLTYQANTQQKMIERFASDTPKNPCQSTGLEFAVAQALVEAHGGTIKLVNQADSGCQFTICLSLAADL